MSPQGGSRCDHEPWGSRMESLLIIKGWSEVAHGKSSKEGYLTTQVRVFPLHVGNQITKPGRSSPCWARRSISWSMEPAYVSLQGICPGESRPQVGVRNLPPSPTFWRKGAEAMRRSLPQSITGPSESFHACTIFRAKMPTSTKAAVLACCSSLLTPPIICCPFCLRRLLIHSPTFSFSL